LADLKHSSHGRSSPQRNTGALAGLISDPARRQ
jgi:hypothetical protein